MEINFETIRDILDRRLHQADIERLLHGLSDADKTMPADARKPRVK